MSEKKTSPCFYSHFEEKMAMTVEVAGPLRGHYLCNLPPNTTVEVNRDAFSIVKQPLGKESSKFRTSEKEERVFIRAKGA